MNKIKLYWLLAIILMVVVNAKTTQNQKKMDELTECVRLLLWELENGYPKESKEEINQRIERIKELNQNKDDLEL